MIHLIVDGANVVGSRPDGWWHDRPGAARRLAEQLVNADRTLLAELAGDPSSSLTVHLVLEGKAKQALQTAPGLQIVLPPRTGTRPSPTWPRRWRGTRLWWSRPTAPSAPAYRR